LRKELKMEIEPNRHVSLPDKVDKNTQSPSKSKPKPVSTTDKQSMAYVIVRNIESETSYLEKDWSLFILKELLDNACDWLNDYYPAKDKEIRRIAVRIWITKAEDSKFVHIAVRNTNVDNIPVFGDLSKSFDFYAWHSTKRTQHRMTSGSLGDALKRCLGMGYASWTGDYNPDEAFEEKEWLKPAIFRRNGTESRVFINVDNAIQYIWAEIQPPAKPTRDIGNDTEVEVTLPLPKSMDDDEYWWIERLREYYNLYKIAKSRTNFSLTINEEKATR